MNRRRVASLLTAVFMVHFSVAASDTACVTSPATPSHSSSAHAGVDAPDMAGMAGMAGTDHAHDEQQPCPTPSPVKCCQALTSYSVAFAGSDADAAGLRDGDARVPNAVDDFATSRVIAPDTPPPKV